MQFKKTTILKDFYATGDYEAFCFDKCKGPEQHSSNKYNHPLQIFEEFYDDSNFALKEFTAEILARYNNIIRDIDLENDEYFKLAFERDSQDAIKLITKAREQQKEKNRDLSEKELRTIFRHFYFDDGYCRIYPNKLIPDKLIPDIYKYNIKGNWKIEITFEPDPNELFKLLLK